MDFWLGISFEEDMVFRFEPPTTIHVTPIDFSRKVSLSVTVNALERGDSNAGAARQHSYGYDNANRREAMQVAGQPQVSYTWDNAKRLTAITQGSSAVSIGNDNANRRTSLTLPNGVTVAYSIDSGSHITALTYSAGVSQLGNLIYGYDADGRVTSKAGSLAASSLPTAVSGNAFNADNGMTDFGSTPLSYDANGNLTYD